MTQNGSKPKRLLITFTNSQAAEDLYTRSRDLRYSHDVYIAANVYINLDLSREQSRLAYLKRVKRRDPTAIYAEVASEVDATQLTDHDVTSLPGVGVGRTRTYWRSPVKKIHSPSQNGATHAGSSSLTSQILTSAATDSSRGSSGTDGFNMLNTVPGRPGGAKPITMAAIINPQHVT